MMAVNWVEKMVYQMVDTMAGKWAGKMVFEMVEMMVGSTVDW